jgi:hypothetical protein
MHHHCTPWLRTHATYRGRVYFLEKENVKPSPNMSHLTEGGAFGQGSKATRLIYTIPSYNNCYSGFSSAFGSCCMAFIYTLYLVFWRAMSCTWGSRDNPCCSSSSASIMPSNQTISWGRTKARRSVWIERHQIKETRARHLTSLSMISHSNRKRRPCALFAPGDARSQIRRQKVDDGSHCSRSRFWFCLPPLPPRLLSPPRFWPPPSSAPGAVPNDSPVPMVSAAVARRLERSIWVRMVLARYETTRTSWIWLLL